MAPSTPTTVVTGAASGIGRATAQRFATAGHRVIAADLDGDGLATLEAETTGISTVVADLSTAADIDRVMEVAGSRVDVLVNNAGIMDRMLLADEVPPEFWDRVFAVNVTAPYLFCRHAIPGMIAAGGGVIVNVASTAGLRGGRARAAYTASKHAVVGLTRNIAATLADDGIRAVAICPGGIRGGARGAREAGARDSVRGAERIRGRDQRRPAVGTADQVAEMIVLVAGDGGARVNGTEIVVDGGATAY